jgi:ABC-2 type transport system permease protein
VRPFYWLVRRELWENRYLYLVPLGAAAVAFFAFLLSAARLPARMRTALVLPPDQQRALLGQPYDFVAYLLMGTTVIIEIFYCVDALYGERRDRSILFWKSMPVSDVTTVLSKAAIPLAVIPALAFVITIATQWVMLLFHSAVLFASGLSVSTLWSRLSPVDSAVMVLYHFFAVHSLWYAPFFGWMLLVSSWARRAPFVWVFLPPFAISVLEKITFNTWLFADILGRRFFGNTSGHYAHHENIVAPPLAQLTPGHFLASPGLWFGLLFTALCLAGAIRLRRYRDPI